MGATSFAPAQRNEIESLSGRMRFVLGSFTFSSSYTSGGETLDLGALWPEVTHVYAVFLPASQGGYVLDWEPVGRKVSARRYSGSGALAEAPGGTDLSTLGPVTFVAYVEA